jgi:hypothetical protein
MVATAEVDRSRGNAEQVVAALPATSIGDANKLVWRVPAAASAACFGDRGPRRDGLYRVIAESR